MSGRDGSPDTFERRSEALEVYGSVGELSPPHRLAKGVFAESNRPWRRRRCLDICDDQRRTLRMKHLVATIRAYAVVVELIAPENAPAVLVHSGEEVARVKEFDTERIA